MKYLCIHLVMLAIATSGCGSDSQPSVVELELPSGEQTLQLEKDEATQSWTSLSAHLDIVISEFRGVPQLIRHGSQWFSC
jgi:hypothetical protein